MPSFPANVFGQYYRGSIEVQAYIKQFNSSGALLDRNQNTHARGATEMRFNRHGDRVFRVDHPDTVTLWDARGGALQVLWMFSLDINFHNGMLVDFGKGRGGQATTWRYGARPPGGSPQLVPVEGERPIRHPGNLHNFSVAFVAHGQNIVFPSNGGELLCNASLSIAHTLNTSNEIGIVGTFEAGGIGGEVGVGMSRGNTQERGASVLFRARLRYSAS